MPDGQAVCASCGMGPIVNSGAAPAAAMVGTPAAPAGPPITSPDGQWVWNGTQWVAAPGPPPPPPPAAPFGGAYQPAGAPYGGPARPQKTNGMAIASLVLGILWLSGLGSLLAVIFGHISKKQIRERLEGGNGLATAGLILGYIGLASALFFILVVVGAVSVFSSQLSEDHAALARSELRNAATAEESYLTDYDVYTNDLGTLASQEYLRIDPGVQLVLGFDGTAGYCLVGNYIGQDNWYLYDSQSGGLSEITYGSASDAEAACSDPSTRFAAPG